MAVDLGIGTLVVGAVAVGLGDGAIAVELGGVDEGIAGVGSADEDGDGDGGGESTRLSRTILPPPSKSVGPLRSTGW